MELEKYSYVEALKWLANKYNVEIEETETTPEVKLVRQAADSLYIINNFAQEFFSNAQRALRFDRAVRWPGRCGVQRRECAATGG